MATDPIDASAPVPEVRLLRCLTCGNTVECKPADMLRFTKTKWLRCCGQVMILFTPSPPPWKPLGDQPGQR